MSVAMKHLAFKNNPLNVSLGVVKSNKDLTSSHVLTQSQFNIVIIINFNLKKANLLL